MRSKKRRYADEDRPSRRILERRRNEDIAFLEMLRTADEKTLDHLYWELPKMPKWRQVAVTRAVARMLKAKAEREAA